MVITIDGPAGSGKSSISKIFASRIGYHVLNTGIMYRSVSWFMMKNNVAIGEKNFHHIFDTLNLQICGTKILLDGEDLSNFLNTSEIDNYTSHYVSRQPFIREKMVLLQRESVLNQDFVVEGRDMGSVVFPDALIKFYLFASVEIRAQRRYAQLGDSTILLEDLYEQIKRRDAEDMSRAVSPLCVPEGAIMVDSTTLTMDEVINILVNKYSEINK